MTNAAELPFSLADLATPAIRATYHAMRLAHSRRKSYGFRDLTPEERAEIDATEAMIQATSMAHGLAVTEELARRGELAHTRAPRTDLQGIRVYRRDRTSPTGVSLATGLPNTPEAVTALRQIRAYATPLSPTEPR